MSLWNEDLGLYLFQCRTCCCYFGTRGSELTEVESVEEEGRVARHRLEAEGSISEQALPQVKHSKLGGWPATHPTRA